MLRIPCLKKEEQIKGAVALLKAFLAPRGPETSTLYPRHRKSREERIKDATVLYETYKERDGLKIHVPRKTWKLLSQMKCYEDACRHFRELGFSRSDAKNIAWVLTCQPAWDEANSKPYLVWPEHCKWFRRWDQIGESFHGITGYPRPPYNLDD